jgi:hypothetical protein
MVWRSAVLGQGPKGPNRNPCNVSNAGAGNTRPRPVQRNRKHVAPVGKTTEPMTAQIRATCTVPPAKPARMPAGTGHAWNSKGKAPYMTNATQKTTWCTSPLSRTGRSLPDLTESRCKAIPHITSQSTTSPNLNLIHPYLMHNAPLAERRPGLTPGNPNRRARQSV